MQTILECCHVVNTRWIMKQLYQASLASYEISTKASGKQLTMSQVVELGKPAQLVKVGRYKSLWVSSLFAYWAQSQLIACGVTTVREIWALGPASCMPVLTLFTYICNSELEGESSAGSCTASQPSCKPSSDNGEHQLSRSIGMFSSPLGWWKYWVLERFSD